MLAGLLLRDAPRYWHGRPSLEELEWRVPIVARMLGNTEATFARLLRDLGYASTRPVVRNIRAPLHIICPVPAKRPHWRPLCLSKEKVSSNVSFLNRLQFTRDLAKHTLRFVPVLCDENIHYRISKMMYAEKTTGWNVQLFLRSHHTRPRDRYHTTIARAYTTRQLTDTLCRCSVRSCSCARPLCRPARAGARTSRRDVILYSFWHTYKFCVTQTFLSFLANGDMLS